MGKRKSTRKLPTKIKSITPLDCEFNCPFCHREKVCEVKMDKKTKTGIVSCRVCNEMQDLSDLFDNNCSMVPGELNASRSTQTPTAPQTKNHVSLMPTSARHPTYVIWL